MGGGAPRWLGDLGPVTQLAEPQFLFCPMEMTKRPSSPIIWCEAWDGWALRGGMGP